MFVTLVLTFYCDLKGKTELFASKKVGFNRLQTHNVFLPLPTALPGSLQGRYLWFVWNMLHHLFSDLTKASFEDEENNGGVINQESFSLGDIT